MKITWFGGHTLRIQLGGEIIVIGSAAAPAGIERFELESGADRIHVFADPALDLFDAASWQKRRPQRMIDSDEMHKPVLIKRIGGTGIVLDAVDEPLLVIADSNQTPQWGRWADGAVVVFTGPMPQNAQCAVSALEVASLRMVALVGGEEGLDDAVDRLRPHLGSASLIVLEPGLAVEI